MQSTKTYVSIMMCNGSTLPPQPVERRDPAHQALPDHAMSFIYCDVIEIETHDGDRRVIAKSEPLNPSKIYCPRATLTTYGELYQRRKAQANPLVATMLDSPRLLANLVAHECTQIVVIRGRGDCTCEEIIRYGDDIEILGE